MTTSIVDAATHIDVVAEPRYWDDAIINGMVDEDGTLVPGRAGDVWGARIELTSGTILRWPRGTTAKLHYKVCDAGEYWLSDRDGRRIAKWDGCYVPDKFLCHGDDGFGDYIILTVDGTGAILGYRRPVIDPDRWEPL